jgi:hypothetical protein
MLLKELSPSAHEPETATEMVMMRPPFSGKSMLSRYN